MYFPTPPTPLLLISLLGLMADAIPQPEIQQFLENRIVLCDNILSVRSPTNPAWNGCIASDGYFAFGKTQCSRFEVYVDPEFTSYYDPKFDPSEGRPLDPNNNPAFINALGTSFKPVIVINKSMATPQAPGPFYCGPDAVGDLECLTRKQKTLMAWKGNNLYAFLFSSLHTGWRAATDLETRGQPRYRLQTYFNAYHMEVTCGPLP